MTATRRRLDAEMVRRGLATTAFEARAAVETGRVTVGGAPATSPASMIRTDESVDVQASASRFVSRGGEKLAAALGRFSIDPSRHRCLDAGASTGGFTDCLLQAGAVAIVAVDVGYGQLAWSLRSDPRITVLDRTNVREVHRGDLPFVPSLLVADLSFISLGSVVGNLRHLSTDDATFVVLVKPQFEVAAALVPAGGVVRDPEMWRGAITRVIRSFEESGVAALDVMASPLRGRSGNVEFLLHAKAGAEASIGVAGIEGALEEGEAVAR